MASSNSSPVSLSDISKEILQAQKISNIIWVIFCITGLLMGILQLITMAFWKPLRKSDQSMILAIAIGDILKTCGFGAIATRRLYATSMDLDDVGSQFHCMIWLFFVTAPMYGVYLLVVAMSVDRILALGAPIWYKNHEKSNIKLYMIVICDLLGILIPCGMFIGSSDSLMVPVCAYGTSPTESYRTIVKYMESTTAIITLVLNITSCLILFYQWRQAVNSHQDMKTFKKKVQLSALKMLLAVAALFLISSALSTFWLVILSDAGWDEYTMMSYAPISGAFELARGVFDFPTYVLMVKEYRMGFMRVICQGRCMKGGNATVGPLGASTTVAMENRGVMGGTRLTLHG